MNVNGSKRADSWPHSLQILHDLNCPEKSAVMMDMFRRNSFWRHSRATALSGLQALSAFSTHGISWMEGNDGMASFSVVYPE